MSSRKRLDFTAFHRVFNFRTEEAKGRSILLLFYAMANIANSIINGALYTAFLAENGIDIIRVGIISFIPYISCVLSVFSPMLLSRFRMRQKLLLLNDVIYYSSIVLATTVMPLFVEDPGAKTVWFAVFLLIGNISNAVIGPGCNTWLLRFVPKGQDLNVYISYTNLVSLVSGNATGIIASIVAAVLASSSHQFWFLFWLRMLAFALFIVGALLIYLIPKDKPVEFPEQKINPIHVVTEPFKYRPFLLTALIIAFWNIIGSFNSGTYNYYMLETCKAPMPYLYVGSVSVMVGSLALSGLFRKYVDRTSPFRVMALSIVLYIILEFGYGCVRPDCVWLFLVLATLSGLVNVGFNMGYNALFYLCLPAGGNKDLYSTNWNLVTNLSMFVGAGLGTWLLAQFEKNGLFRFLGMDLYGSQMLCFVKMLFFVCVLLYLLKITPYLQKHRSA